MCSNPQYKLMYFNSMQINCVCFKVETRRIASIVNFQWFHNSGSKYQFVAAVKKNVFDAIHLDRGKYDSIFEKFNFLFGAIK